jgi:hypothetical protein
MNSPNASTLTALEALRRQAAHTVELCDSILYGQPSLATSSTLQLVPALRLLSSRVQLTLEAVEQKGAQR